MLINGIRWNHGCSPHPFFEIASMRVLLHGNTWGFFHPWTILVSLLLMSWAQPASNEGQKKLQLYHDFLSVLLQEVKYATTNKPVMMINLSGVWQKRRLHIHVTVKWVTRSHRATYVAGSLLTPEMQKEFTTHA
jgi:hypothetical protein